MGIFPLLALTLAAPPAPGSDEFFEARVRPVLVTRCASCHAGNKLKGGLSVEGRAALLKGGDSGPAVVPGKPDESRLIEAVRYATVDLQMPPKGKLAAAEIDDLVAWVRAGAPWPAEKGGAAAPAAAVFDLAARARDHWAWHPVRATDPPAVADRAWGREPVDAFVLAKLEALGLKPAPPAPPEVWLRRVTFDLTGLPPAAAEVTAFLADPGPAARAAVVDRLLASPAFGERWARHWLDLVRYAETRGHEFDPVIPNARQYRDYVVRAINADVPHDALVREHIAGDLVPIPRTDPVTGANESVLGTGFWFLGEEVHSPVDIRQDQADRFDNRIDVATKAFLGLTVACARCHDHKFDAVSARDYYALYGFLSSSSYRQVRLDHGPHNAAVAADLAALRAKAAPAVGRALADTAGGVLFGDLLAAAGDVLKCKPADRDAATAAVARERTLDPKALAGWVAVLAADPLHGATGPAAAPAEVVIDYAKVPEGGWLPDGPAFGSRPRRRGELALTGTPERPAVEVADRAAAAYDRTWDVLRAAPGSEVDHGALGGIPNRSGRTLRTPTFKIAGGAVHYLARGSGAVYAAVASHTLVAGPLHGELVTKFTGTGPGFRWHRLDLSRYKGLDAHLEFTPAVGSDFAVAAVAQGDRPPTPPGDADTAEALAAAFDEAVRRLRDDSLSADDASPRAVRVAGWLARHPELLADGGRKVSGVAAEFLTQEQKIAARIRPESRLAPAMLDGTGVDERVFVRGSAKAEGEPAPRRFLQALGGSPVRARGSGRLELAAAVTDPKNPLTARVAVNRVWHHLFGRGIVASVDNFGVLGDRPSHPELLDHLADRFVRDGWSTKKLVRTLVLSNAYSQASRPSAAGDAADAGNVYLHRARVRRLDAEAVRDALLAVSGRLDRTVGGPSVPVHLTEFQGGRGRPGSGPLDGNGRRSLYLAVRRNFASPLLAAFDQPVPFSTVGRRTVSNVPAQSLILMNDPFVHDQAAVWGKRTAARPGTVADRVRHMYLEAFARPATDDEVAACASFLAARAGEGNPPDAAAWAALAHALFNAKEFLFLG
jgi:hypothetical protein